MEQEKKVKNSLSTMKIWGLLSYSICIIVTIITIFGVFYTEKDMTVLGTICGLTFGEVSVYSAVYAYKEKAANKMKMSLSFIEKLADKYGIDSIAPILQGILQD